MPNYLCRPAELNSSSPVLPEGAHSLEHNSLELSEDSENLRGRGEEERKRQMEQGETQKERERR